MRHRISMIGIGITVASLAIPAFGQSTDANTTLKAADPVAYVYIGTSAGVDLYDAASNGKLTLAKGSPFAVSGFAIGSNGTHFISVGTSLIHSYAVSSSGAIGEQVSSIDSQDYYNVNCYGQSNAVSFANLDHTGRDLYVIYNNLYGNCDSASIQTYLVSKTGLLTFDGSIPTGGNAGDGLFEAPAINGHDTFAYAASLFDCCGGPPAWSGYRRAIDGPLENLTFNLSNGNFVPFGYAPFYVTADPANHLAAIVENNPGPEEYGPPLLATFTIDSEGNLSSTSTAKNMPKPKVNPFFPFPTVLNMSPSGKLLAIGGSGLQVFHFNGGNPITPFSSVLTPAGAAINQIHWDNNNHLYALSEEQTTSYLSWNTTNLTQAKLTGSDGFSYQIGGCTGTCGESNLPVSPKATTIYTITGTATDGHKLAVSVTVTVNSKPATKKAPSGPSSSGASSVTLSASPNSFTNYSQLFVYTATPTRITAAPGSPYRLSSNGVDSLIVVPVP